MRNFFIICAAILFLTSATVFADEEEEIQQLEEEKAAYEQEAEKARAVSELIQGKIDSVSELKRELDEDAYIATTDYEEKQAALDETLYRIDENETKLVEVTEELNEKHAVLKKRVRDIYINGQISYLDVLFGAQDFGDFLTRMDLLKRVMIRDSELVADVLAYQKEIKEVGKQLEADKRIQEELATKAQAAMEVKLEKVAKQQALIDLMQNDKDVYDRQYDEMMASSAEVGRLIHEKEEEMRRAAEEARRQAEIEANPQANSYQRPANFGGGMIWPVSGPITSEFGWRTHPIFGSARFHSGLDIGADYGVPICAAASGVVIESGWIGGYGNTIMIDHGGGIVTLYGHNESLAVGVGQTVNQGDVIAYCGSTGNSTGPHCHFEVRLCGEPVSPWDYL
ncbi:MAG: peptidoglycan DD-metalloendopeptidase family protein [Selenomonadaceae bacterium]|nr:peptidoglycan DD-metalloendopeptidase family protein [Selenomonadaceae bacterium]